MRIRKTLIALLAMAIAVAFSPLPELQAATLGPDSRVQVDNQTHAVAMKKKGKKKGKKGKRAKSKGPGKCGAFMYHSKKTRKCADARNK